MCILLTLVVTASGCRLFRKKVPAPQPTYGATSVNPNVFNPAVTATPPVNTNSSQLLIATAAVGKVASVNVTGRFVVLQFPIAQVPAVGTLMVVYHGDAKTAEVKITGPTTEDLTVADIVLGTVQENDEVRSN